MANVDNANGFSWAGNLLGGNIGPLTMAYPQKNGTTITIGDFVIFGSGQGYVDIAVSTSPQLLGVAAQTQTATAATEDILVVVARYGDLFEGQCEGTPTQASVGLECDIIGATGAMEIDENATVEDVIQIVRLVDDGNNAMGANARMLVTVIRSDFTSTLEDQT